MIDRETLAANIMCAYVASESAVIYSKCFALADSFLAYAAKQREKVAGECRHKWVDSIITSKAWVCDICEAYKAKPEPPKPERKARAFFPVGTRVMVFDRYRLAIPCCGEVIKTDGVTEGCLVRLDANSHGRAAERYPDGIYVCFEQLREILPKDGK